MLGLVQTKKRRVFLVLLNSIKQMLAKHTAIHVQNYILLGKLGLMSIVNAKVIIIIYYSVQHLLISQREFCPMNILITIVTFTLR